MYKKALFAFNGEEMCFAHVLLNALDMHKKGFEVKIVIEGAACSLLNGYAENRGMFPELFNNCRNEKLIECVCRACAVKTKAADAAEKLGLHFSDDMNGHPSMSSYIERGYGIITF